MHTIINDAGFFFGGIIFQLFVGRILLGKLLNTIQNDVASMKKKIGA